MRLEEITDDILAEAVDTQAGNVFDSHDIIFWVMQNYPRQYAADLHGALSDEGDPFVNLHMAFGRRLTALSHLLEQQHRKVISMNVRGEETACEVWQRVAPPAGSDLPPKLNEVRQQLMEIARRGNVINYRPVANLLGIPDDVRLDHCRELFQALDDISTFEHRSGRPLLSVVVIRQETNCPGNGFFTMARRNGVQPADQDDTSFFDAELKKAYEYWQRHQE